MPYDPVLFNRLQLNNVLVTAGIKQPTDIIGPPLTGIAKVLDDIEVWVIDSIDSVITPIRDTLGKFQTWTLETINNITEEIRIQKYRFRSALGEWMQDPLNFFLALGGFIIASAILPSFITELKSSNVWLFAKESFEAIKIFSGTFLEKIGFVQALNIHKILLLINPEYQNFWGQLDSAFMGLAEEIEIGVGTLNNLNAAIRNVYYSTYTMIGLDTDTIEIRFYDDATKFWGEARKDWERYIRNPQLVFDDAMRKLVYPILMDATKYGNERIQNELKVAQDLSQTIENVNKVRKSIDDLIDTMPDEVQASIDKNLGTFRTAMEMSFNDFILPIRDKLVGTIDILDESHKRTREAVERNTRSRTSAVDGIIYALYDDTLDTVEKRSKINALFDRIFKPSLDSLNANDLLLIAQDTVNKYVPEKSEEPSPPENYTSLVRIDFESIRKSAEPWFVGEY